MPSRTTSHTTSVDLGADLPHEVRTTDLAPHEMLLLAATDALDAAVLAVRCVRTVAYSAVLAHRRLSEHARAAAEQRTRAADQRSGGG